jgi:DHA1 family bicyclomycin/chloramphenicol resistance-like MFS transporter
MISSPRPSAVPDPSDAEPGPGGPLTRHALVLGMLTAMGAFGIDLYLPAFPAIAGSLGVSEGAVQRSLVSYFIALALGQLVYGPVSDRVGRKPPLVVGFALFAVASVWAAFATSVDMLVAARFVQGLGACAGMVLSRAVVRDLRSGEEAARLYALMLLVLSVSPLLAPMIGSLMVERLPWQAVFWFLAALGGLCLTLVVAFLEETNPPAKRTAGGLGVAFANYARLAKDKSFLGIVMVGGLSQGALFAYLAGSSPIYITIHHVTPTAYSLLFALNAVGLIGAAQFNVWLMRRLGSGRLLWAGALVQTAAAVALLAATLTGWDTVPVLAALLFVTLGCQGVLGPTSAVVALEPHAAAAGAASALMGALQFGCGAASSALVSVFYERYDGSAVPMATVIAGCCAAGLAFVAVGSAGRRPADAAVRGRQGDGREARVDDEQRTASGPLSPVLGGEG